MRIPPIVLVLLVVLSLLLGWFAGASLRSKGPLGEVEPQAISGVRETDREIGEELKTGQGEGILGRELVTRLRLYEVFQQHWESLGADVVAELAARVAQGDIEVDLSQSKFMELCDEVVDDAISDDGERAIDEGVDAPSPRFISDVIIGISSLGHRAGSSVDLGRELLSALVARGRISDSEVKDIGRRLDGADRDRRDLDARIREFELQLSVSEDVIRCGESSSWKASVAVVRKGETIYVRTEVMSLNQERIHSDDVEVDALEVIGVLDNGIELDLSPPNFTRLMEFGEAVRQFEGRAGRFDWAPVIRIGESKVSLIPYELSDADIAEIVCVVSVSHETSSHWRASFQLSTVPSLDEAEFQTFLAWSAARLPGSSD